MSARADVLRKSLGPYGLWTSALQRNHRPAAEEAIRAYETQGWTGVWYPEGPIMDAFVQGSQHLQAASGMTVASGIASIYLRNPSAMAVAGRNLADAFDGRFVLGLGVSHAPYVNALGLNYEKPIETMRAYVDTVLRTWEDDGSTTRPPLVLAALGPRMLDLAADRADGAHPYFTPVEHTRVARDRLGPDPVLAVEVTAVLDRDRSRALRKARLFAESYVESENYVNNLRLFGYTDDDFAGGGSRRLLDAVVVQGDVRVVARRVREHLDAGADHVCVQLRGDDAAALLIESHAELADELHAAAPS